MEPGPLQSEAPNALLSESSRAGQLGRGHCWPPGPICMWGSVSRGKGRRGVNGVVATGTQPPHRHRCKPPQPAGQLNVNKVRVQSKPPAALCRSRCLRDPGDLPGQPRPPPPESERAAGAAAGSLRPQEGRGRCKVCGLSGQSGEGRGPALNTGGLSGPCGSSRRLATPVRCGLTRPSAASRVPPT